MTEARSGNRDYSVDSIERFGDRVVVAVSWSNRYSERCHWAQTLRLHDGRIVDMQDYRSPGRASASARLRTVFTATRA